MPETLDFPNGSLDITGLDSEALRVLEEFHSKVHALTNKDISPGFRLFLDFLDTMRVTSTGQVYCSSRWSGGGKEVEISIIRGKVVYINAEGELDNFSEFGPDHIIVLESKKRALMLSQIG